jgi:hypothetical protein
MSELADLLEVHIRTVQTWHENGLSPFDCEKRPFLFHGLAVKRFLTELAGAGRTKLAPTEFYCPRCKTGRESNPSDLRCVITNRRMGRDDYQVLIKGTCILCGCRLTRFSTRNRLILSPFCTIAKGAEAVLKGNSTTPSATDLKEVSNEKFNQ